MKNYFNKIKVYVSSHKTVSVVILIIIILVGYSGYKKITNPGAETRYVLATVAQGTVISTVSGSGQVSALNEISITPTVSGTITGVRINREIRSKRDKLFLRLTAPLPKKRCETPR